MGTHLNYSGFVVAGIGFFLTRFTVTLAIYEDPVRFYLAGVVPLALGLGLAAFGVALAVADVDASLVRTTALWCVVGAGSMLVIVVLTLLGSTTGGMPDFAALRSRAYLSNFLIGGSIGGTLTGLYAARNRRQRDALRQQANRLVVLNRMLRHEVLNAVTVIQGYVSLTDDDPEARERIAARSNDIEETIEQVKYLAGSTELDGRSQDVMSLEDILAASVQRVRDSHPEADISLDAPDEDLLVSANDRLETVFVHLLENAVVHGTDEQPRVEVSVTATASTVRVSVRDEGPGLPESQRELLESGDIPEFDDPRTGFGLNVVRLLVENFGGSLETDVDDEGTTVTLALPRADSERADRGPRPADLAGVRPAIPHLVVTLAAALIAGVVYGVVSEALGSSIAGIGVFYGTVDPVVGWLTHEFHSVVFAFIFVGLVSLVPERYRAGAWTYVVVGIGWALVIWVVAASFVAPAWLRLLGISASIPNFSVTLLVNHLAWGASLGLLTAWGYESVTPWMRRRVA